MIANLGIAKHIPVIANLGIAEIWKTYHIIANLGIAKLRVAIPEAPNVCNYLG